MKILLIFGTRPEAIKMASLALKFKDTEHQVKICITAQHREMLDSVLEFFNIDADYDLNLMQKNQTLSNLAAQILKHVDNVLEDFYPDIALVHGDTTTAMASSIAAFHRGIKIGHVEAGLRSGDFKAPFPEEMNRVVIDSFADYLFAPTQRAVDILKNENKNEHKIYLTGNSVIDALKLSCDIIDNSNILKKDIYASLPELRKDKKYILVTGHRRENFGGGFLEICNAIKELALRNDVEIIYPVHLNPNVQQPVYDLLSDHNNIKLIAPLDYPKFITLMRHSHFILTDSGGIQEEAPSLQKPVLVMRGVTERQEAVNANLVKLVGTSKEKILEYSNLLLDDKIFYNSMIAHSNPYGDGQTASTILNILEKDIV